MGSHFSIFAFSYMLLLLLMSINYVLVAEAVKNFKVGDGFGWQVPAQNDTVMYSQWASRNRFQVGDSLSFEYKNDSVFQVDKWGFYHCNASKATIGFDNGKSVLKLDRSGPFFFISGTHDHCKNGQRLLVEVMGLHPISHLPPPASVIAVPPGTDLAPWPLPSSGSLLHVTTYSVFIALILAIFSLVFLFSSFLGVCYLI